MHLSLAFLGGRSLLRCNNSRIYVTRLRTASFSLTSLSRTSDNNVKTRASPKNVVVYNKLFHSHNVRGILGIDNVFQTRYFSTRPEDDDQNVNDDSFSSQLPATVAVPDVWPHLPVIAINRHIVFPRFIKLIEVGEDIIYQ